MMIGIGDIVAVFFFGAAFGAWVMYRATKNVENVAAEWKKAAMTWKDAAEAWKIRFQVKKDQYDVAVAAVQKLNQELKKNK